MVRLYKRRKTLPAKPRRKNLKQDAILDCLPSTLCKTNLVSQNVILTERKLGSREVNTLVSVVLLTRSTHSLFVTHIIRTAMVVPNRDLPKRLPLLILRDKVLLPGSSMRIAVRDDARYLEICLHFTSLDNILSNNFVFDRQPANDRFQITKKGYFE